MKVTYYASYYREYRQRNLTKLREYNRLKQKEYRIRNGAKPRLSTDEILSGPGHCSFCGMLLESDYHKTHPLVGCQIAARRKQ